MLVNRVHKPYSCKICGNAVGLKVCKCQKAYYCSKNCQKIDWKVHKSDCFKFVEHPTTSTQLPANNPAASNLSSSQLHQLQHNNISNLHSHDEVSREGQQHRDILMQYQHQPTIATNTTLSSSTIEDFGENLLNTLMYSVDESTEKEILKNLQISEEELLKSFNLDAVTDDQNSKEYQPFNADDQSFDEKIFERIQRQESFELKPEYKETREKLEKELLLFREINLHEPQQQLGGEKLDSRSEMMQISTNNPKYINHGKLDDHLLYK